MANREEPSTDQLPPSTHWIWTEAYCLGGRSSVSSIAQFIAIYLGVKEFGSTAIHTTMFVVSTPIAAIQTDVLTALLKISTFTLEIQQIITGNFSSFM